MLVVNAILMVHWHLLVASNLSCVLSEGGTTAAEGR